MSRYNADDAWETLEDYYGDDLETNNQEFVSKVQADFSKDSLTYGEGDPVEYVDSLKFTLIDDKGGRHECEMVGRIDNLGKTYLLVHLIDDPNPSSLIPLIAWDDENGQMQLCDIQDENEYREVLKMVESLMIDDPEAEDIPGGGVQWND